MQGPIATWLIAAGLALVVIGLLFKAGLLGWLGNLPGDVRIERDNFRFYFPLTSMILVSILLSVIAAIARRFF